MEIMSASLTQDKPHIMPQLNAMHYVFFTPNSALLDGISLNGQQIY